MIGVTRRGTQSSARGAMAARRVAIALITILCLPAAAASGAASRANPPLAGLHIDLWPEYDRPAVLVIIKGEIAPEVALPATVSLRISAMSGGPSAVAFSSEASGGLLNAKYEREDAGEHIRLKIQAPERHFHVEFYEPLATRTPDRNYTYIWPGDLAAERLAVTVQEPAGTLDLSAEPKLDTTAQGQDGLRYRSAQLGAIKAGRQLPIKIAYTKSDPRTSREILRPQADGSLPALSSPPGERASDAGSGWVLAITVGLPLAIALGAAFLLLWRRRAAAAARPSGRHCPQCGAQAGRLDRFCSKCGAQLR